MAGDLSYCNLDRKLIERLLKTFAYYVTAVDSGSKALEFLGLQDVEKLPSFAPNDCQPEVEVNLIITDYCMPGMTAFELLRKIKKDKENEVERLQSEIERLKSRCNDMKQFLKENELEKQNLKKKVLLLNSDLKKKDKTISSLDKKLKDGTKTSLKNNKSVLAPPGPKEVTNMKDRIKLLEVNFIPLNSILFRLKQYSFLLILEFFYDHHAQIKLKETALEISEASFLEKEKNLQQKIEELERRLEVLDQDTENPQISTTENSNPTIISDDAIKPEINKTEDQEIFEKL
ncbi:hypothetical protein L2E82_31240 [Cichorium intybus]|uniref:Uncharacterized protein n=1 Tax=Cichorium intybus TaxID=13427 RepID=A0ACB9D2D2_CICIN|nr:hypothetical protein L2E82_31240 [Cichorium intybus]